MIDTNSINRKTAHKNDNHNFNNINNRTISKKSTRVRLSSTTITGISYNMLNLSIDNNTEIIRVQTVEGDGLCFYRSISVISGKSAHHYNNIKIALSYTLENRIKNSTKLLINKPLYM